MIKAGDVLGRAVTVREGGHEAGKIRDLVVDQAGKQVLGFIISEGIFKSTRVAAWAALQAIGPDAVVLSSFGSIVKASEAADIKAALDSGTSIRGLRLQTTEGKDLGKIEDFYFDDESGAVEGYEISGGIFSGTFGGRSFLPTPVSIELGKDVAFVGIEAEATIRQEGGGIRGAFRRSEE
jgi:uncharacterized protein YrrD